MIRRPPRAPLFPSTTLFRSRISRASRAINGAKKRSARADRAMSTVRLVRALAPWIRTSFRPISGMPLTVSTDRKSTRLNSSHANISYAVFCLKKKIADRRVRKVAAGVVFFFDDTATTESSTLSLHDALPISDQQGQQGHQRREEEERQGGQGDVDGPLGAGVGALDPYLLQADQRDAADRIHRSEEHTSELQSRQYLVCRLLLEKKNCGSTRAKGCCRGCFFF